MNNIQTLVSLSDEAYRSKDFARAMVLLDEIIDRSPESAEGLGSRHLRAMAYEFGNAPGGVDLHKSLADYKALVERADVVGSVGLVGSARVLCELGLSEHAAEIKELCLRAISVDSAPAARMLLGYVATELDRDNTAAKKWFFSAFLKGSPWGMRYFAVTHWREQNYVRGALSHLLSVIAWPFLSLLKRTSSPYHF